MTKNADAALRARLAPFEDHAARFGLSPDGGLKGMMRASSDGNWRRAARMYLSEYAPSKPPLWRTFGKGFAGPSDDRRPLAYAVYAADGRIVRQAATPSVARLIINQRGADGDYYEYVGLPDDYPLPQVESEPKALAGPVRVAYSRTGEIITVSDDRETFWVYPYCGGEEPVIEAHLDGIEVWHVIDKKTRKRLSAKVVCLSEEDEERAATAVMRELVRGLVRRFKAGESSKALLEEYHSGDTTVYDVLQIRLGFVPVRELITQLPIFHPSLLECVPDLMRPHRFSGEYELEAQ